MINSIDLLRLRNGEFIQFSKNFTSIINRNNPTTLLVQTQYADMLAKETELEALYKIATANPMTAMLEALDLRRDRAVNGIVGLIRDYGYHFNPAMVEAATVLQNNLALYGGSIAKENYPNESAIINNLVNDWQTKPELQNAIDMLGILDWVTELKTANDDFDEKYLDRTQDYGSASPENLKSKRAEAMTTYYALRKRLESHADIEGTPLYTTTINELNALIEQYNAILNARTTVTENTETMSPN